MSQQWYTVFFMEDYPMKWLSYLLRQDLANKLDGYEANFPELASRLSYTIPEINNIQARTRHMPEFGGSLIMSLMHHYDNVKQGSIQELQRALMSMNHPASSIIPRNISSIRESAIAMSRQEQREQPSRRGDTNTELSECDCSGCQNNRNYNQMSASSFNLQQPPSFQRSSPSSFVGCYPQPMSRGYSPRRFSGLPGERNQMSESVEIPILPLDPTSLQRSEPTVEIESCSGRSSPNHVQPAPAIGLQNPSQERQGFSSQSCSCEKCRLSSDPEETLLLKTYDSTSVKCPQGIDSAQKQTKIVYDRNSWCGESASPPDVLRVSYSDPSTLHMKGKTSKEKSSVLMQNRGSCAMQIYKFNVRSPSEPSINNFDNPPSSLDHQTHIGVQNITENVSRSTNVDSRDNASSSGGTRAHETGSKNESSIPREINPVNEPFGFVTYSCETPYRMQDWRHLHDVLNLCEEISNAGIKIYLDMDSKCMTSLRLNRLDWLDMMIREANFIIVCISPMYNTAIHETEEAPQARPAADDLNARYIYDQLRTEFRNNHARNHRLIPVLFPEANRYHIPAFMGSTLIYSYPRIKDSITGVIREHYL